jgi:hypothetical protein
MGDTVRHDEPFVPCMMADRQQGWFVATNVSPKARAQVRRMPRRDEPDPLAAAIGRRIRAFREERGLRLEQVAFAGGLASKGHLSDLEHGRVIPTVTTLRGVAEELGVTLVDLVNVDAGGLRGRLVERSRTAPESLLARWLDEAVSAAPEAAHGAGGVELLQGARRPRGAVPVVELDALATGPDAAPATHAIGWVKLDARTRALPGVFVARVREGAMAPRVPDGAYAVFRRPAPGNRRGRVFLVRTPGERGEASTCALRLVDTARVAGATRVTLRALDPAHRSRTLDAARDGVHIVAELVRVLGAAAD